MTVYTNLVKAHKKHHFNFKTLITNFVYLLYKKVSLKLLAKVNKALLPSFTKRKIDLGRALKIQLTLFGYRL